MHTIKGNARTYQFNAVTNLVHDAETTYDRLRKEPDYPWNRNELLHELSLVRNAIENYATIKAEKLANTTNAEIPENCILISQVQYQELLSESKQSEANNPRLSHLLKRFNTLSLETVLHDLIESLPSVAKQLNKPAPNVKTQLTQVLIHKQHTELMNNVFTHLLRNAIDHGIEATDVRQTKGKDVQGTIYLESELANNNGKQCAHLWLWDDGQGINLKRLKSKAIEAGYAEETLNSPQAIANCLFMSGVSTAENITAISGRGVGMDAVKKYLQQQGCDIAIVMRDTQADPKAEFAHFKLKITLAPELYEANE